MKKNVKMIRKKSLSGICDQEIADDFDKLQPG